MLLLLQAVAKQFPPINITVQQPPGLPEWIKILITAGIGALVGITSNIAMEVLKPYIAKRLLKASVDKQLGDELMENLSQIEAVNRLLKSVDLTNPDDRELALDVAGIIVSGVQRDRYDFYFSTQKALFYEMDATRALSAFYNAAENLRFKKDQKQAEDFIQVSMMASVLGNALRIA
jgi:hypothetical protein